MEEIKRFFENFKTNIWEEYPLYCILAGVAVVLIVVGIIVAAVLHRKKKAKSENGAKVENADMKPSGEIVTAEAAPSEKPVEPLKEEEATLPDEKAEENAQIEAAPAEVETAENPVAEEETSKPQIEEKPVLNLAKEEVRPSLSDDEWKPANLSAKREPKKEAPKPDVEETKKEEEYDPFQKAVVTVPKKSAKPKAEPAKEVKEETVVEPATKAAPKAQTKKAAAPKAEKAVTVEEKPAVVEEAVKKPVQKDIDMNETAATVVGGKKVVGKYLIEANEDFYQFSLYANNGQLLYESREYATLATCKSGIETFKKNVAECDYRVAQDKNGNWKYIFRKGNSIYIGESYSTEQSAENSAISTKRFAGISELQEK